MSRETYKKIAQEILNYADIRINGNKNFDIQVYNPDFYKRVLTEGQMALGESYIEGWWDVKNLDEFFYRVIKGRIKEHIGGKKRLLWNYIKAKLINMQSKKRAHKVGRHHYDTGNDLYKLMLDKRMNYSCGYWKNAENLDIAQEKKLDLICKKIGLKKGMKILDIGCGWGSFAKYASTKYGVSVVGITISKNQAEVAKENCKNLQVEIKLLDYRKLNDKFDRIVSIGMFEHVGNKNYRTFMKIIKKNLKPDGLFLLHTIGTNKSTNISDPWFHKYIFPNGSLPSIKQIGKSIEKLFVMEDLHNIGADYDKTLIEWYNNFNKGWNKIKSNYDDMFYRMWKYYLLSMAGFFRSREGQVWQIVLSPKGIIGGYKNIR